MKNFLLKAPLYLMLPFVVVGLSLMVWGNIRHYRREEIKRLREHCG